MLRRTSTFLCTIEETVSVSSELKKLLPALLPILDPPLPKGIPVSAAHLIVATSHSNSNRRISGAHLQDCPVFARTLPLTSISHYNPFATRPCPTCIKRRVHYLASEHFCFSLAEQCRGRNSKVDIPLEWEAIATENFGSLARLQEELVMYAVNRREPGWTWLVYDRKRIAGHRLATVNLPSNRVPLILGIWPLAVINMTEGALLTEMEAKPNVNTAKLTPPLWSRAARNPLAATATMMINSSNTSSYSILDTMDNVGKDLSTIRTKVAQDAVSQMNWNFVLQQWQKAEVYYNSADRDENIRTQRTKLEREAALAAMSKLRDSGATIFTSDTVEITNAGSNTITGNIAQEEGKVDSTKTIEDVAKITTTTETTENTTNTTKNTNSNTNTNEDPQCKQLGDGTWEYIYRNGDVTLLRPDGTRVFKKSNVTTTAFADGSTLYEYPNNTSILDRIDGVRVTTFADGTKKEELVK